MSKQGILPCTGIDRSTYYVEEQAGKKAQIQNGKGESSGKKRGEIYL
jgi:hypothetical protein